MVFDWGIATGLTLRTVFDWLKSLGFHERNLYCLALIGVPSEIQNKFLAESVMLAAEATFRQGTIYVDKIHNTPLNQTKDWGHSHYPVDTLKGFDELISSLQRVVRVTRSDIEALGEIYMNRPSLEI